MTQHRDIERILDHWLGDGPSQVSDRVFDEAVERIDRQSQRPGWLLRRELPMSSLVKISLVAAVAVVAVAVVGLGLGRPSGPGSNGLTPAASPSLASSTTPSNSPSPAASASAALPAWYTISDSDGAGILPAGSHATRSFRPGFSFTVPGGWVNAYDSGSAFLVFKDTPANQAEFARSGQLAQSINMGPQQSPWFVCAAEEHNTGATAAEIAAAVAANEAIATSGVVDVAIGGLTGKQFDVRLNPDWTGTCPPNPDDPPDPADARTRAILLDTKDQRVIVIFVGSMTSAGHEAFLAEAMPIVESFQFNLAP